ncbi:MAG: coproporphyrinogen III oxidase [bacterium ADurb.Bin431]|jgi:radical SAM superfamily enzyme YgiQ (UPF0313 family)|nr:MAG: coproporphyrinogen III oxidase [bacterium ADurb.Bin431]
MNYEGPVIRPPSEARSLILQVTVGCSHNRCTFCPAYKGRRFRIKDGAAIRRDIDEAGAYSPDIRRVFLADGDALILSQRKLLDILGHLHRRFPALQRVGTYANAKGVLRKSAEELRELKEHKLGIIYLGIESGDDETLAAVRKGATADRIAEAAARVKDAGIKLSVTVLLGVAGRERSLVHARETARLLTRVQPDYVGALTLMLVPGAPLCDAARAGSFILPSPFELVRELKVMIEESDLHHCLFFSNHASNYVPVQARLPRDKKACLQLLNAVLSQPDRAALTPEYLRAL